MQAFTESVLNSLEADEQHDAITIDYSRVVRVLLRDGWHACYKTSPADREGLAVTIKGLRRKLDHPNPSTPYSDEEMIQRYPQFVPYKQNPTLQPKPFRRVMVEGAPWAVWNESRDPIPVLAELMVPWNQILALDVEAR